MWTGSFHYLNYFVLYGLSIFPPFFNSHTFLHLITSWISSLKLARRWVFSSKPLIISLWSCSTIFWDAFKIFLVWVTRHWGMLMPLQLTVCLSFKVSQCHTKKWEVGGSWFSSSGSPIVSSGEEMDIFGFLSCACNFRGPTSTRGDSGLPESCRQSDRPSDFTVVLIPGTKPFASLFFPSYSSVGKESTCNAGRPQCNSWVRKIHWRRDRLPAPVFLGFPCGSVGKESDCNTGDLGSIPGLGRSPGEGKDCSLQYSGLENSMDCIVHGDAKSQTWLSNFHFSLLKVHGLFSTKADTTLSGKLREN